MGRKMSKWFWVGLIVLAATAQLATAAVLTVGQSGADYTDFSDAVNAVTEANSTIRFIDSAVYDETDAPSLANDKWIGLTIESVAGQKATLNFTGAGAYGMNLGRANMTIQNMIVKNSGRSALISTDGNAANATMANVDFISTVTGGSTYLLGVGGQDTSVSYCTFLGTGPNSTGGRGISASSTGLTVDHCSFDQIGFGPIYVPSYATLTVTNSAFGAWYQTSAYRAAIYMGGGTLNEDYNASWGAGRNLTYGEAGSVITNGANSFKVGTYAEIFTGNTGAGNWAVGSALYQAASDGSHIGASSVAQVPDDPRLLTVGQTGAEYTDFSDALNAVTEVNSTIRFIDSATYNEADQPSLANDKWIGLTIESAEGQKATVNFIGSGGYGMCISRADTTIQNLIMKNSGRDSLLIADGNGINATITNVDFINTVVGGSNYLLGAASGMTISYCTFLGTSDTSTGGRGINTYGAGISVDHCSFDKLGFAPIYNTDSSTTLTVTNSAFGAWNNTSYYKAAIYWEAGTLTEDYNASWGGGQVLAYGSFGSTINHGGHSFQVQTYAELFVGDTAAGNWTGASALYQTASDGSHIGAGSAILVPVEPTVLTVGQSGADYTSFAAALNGVTEPNTTVRFIDSATYDEINQPSLTLDKWIGLTIESAEGQKATVNFVGSGGYGFAFGRADVTIQNMIFKNSGRDALVLADGNGTNATITNVDFISTVNGGYLLGTGPGMAISYCTFLGTGANLTGGDGISWAANTSIAVNHCSFDQLRLPIYNSWNSMTTAATVTNCAFGAWLSTEWWGAAILIDGDTSTVTEDYNASYGPNSLIRADQLGKVTSGGHSFQVSAYADLFTGNTAVGDWTGGFELYHAASDGTNIGVGPATDQPQRIPGDANHDGMVDVGDLGILAANYGGSGKTWEQGDFNGDGLVDVGDLGILAANYGSGVNATVDFAGDYAKAFGTAAEEDDSADETGSSICSGLGLPLVMGLLLAGLMLVKLEE